MSDARTLDFIELHSALERFGFEHWRHALRYMREREREADRLGDTDLSSSLSTAAMWLRADRSRTAASYFKIAYGGLMRALDAYDRGERDRL